MGIINNLQNAKDELERFIPILKHSVSTKDVVPSDEQTLASLVEDIRQIQIVSVLDESATNVAKEENIAYGHTFLNQKNEIMSGLKKYQNIFSFQKVKTDNRFKSPIVDMIYAYDKLFAISKNQYGYSIDGGYEWMYVSEESTYNFSKLYYSNRVLFALTTDGKLYYSNDGSTLTLVTIPDSTAKINDVIFFENKFICVSENPVHLFTSENGYTWVEELISFTSYNIKKLMNFNNKLIAFAIDTEAETNSTTTVVFNVLKKEDNKWHRKDTKNLLGTNYLGFTQNDKMICVKTNSGKIYKCEDFDNGFSIVLEGDYLIKGYACGYFIVTNVTTAMNSLLFSRDLTSWITQNQYIGNVSNIKSIKEIKGKVFGFLETDLYMLMNGEINDTTAINAPMCVEDSFVLTKKNGAFDILLDDIGIIPEKVFITLRGKADVDNKRMLDVVLIKHKDLIIGDNKVKDVRFMNTESTTVTVESGTNYDGNINTNIGYLTANGFRLILPNTVDWTDCTVDYIAIGRMKR